jgi:hypothetical protein
LNIVTTTSIASEVAVISAIVLAGIVIAVIAAFVGGRNGNVRTVGPVTYFLYGLSLLTLVVGVSTAGITVHAVTELVGPTPQAFPFGANLPPCPSSPSSTTTSTTTPGPFGGSGGFPCLDPSGQVTIYGSSQNPDQNPAYLNEGSNSSVLGFAVTDDTNHYISMAVTAGLFAVAALVGYLLVWRRANKLIDTSGFGQPPVGRFPLSYAYLVAGLAAVALLVFVPLTADSIFRAIAPGVNGASGHADGIRSLVTFLTLGLLSGGILRYHLQLAATLRKSQPPPGINSENPSPPAGPTI